jgi:hypothetical protein
MEAFFKTYKIDSKPYTDDLNQNIYSKDIPYFLSMIKTSNDLSKHGTAYNKLIKIYNKEKNTNYELLQGMPTKNLLRQLKETSNLSRNHSVLSKVDFSDLNVGGSLSEHIPSSPKLTDIKITESEISIPRPSANKEDHKSYEQKMQKSLNLSPNEFTMIEKEIFTSKGPDEFEMNIPMETPKEIQIIYKEVKTQYSFSIKIFLGLIIIIILGILIYILFYYPAFMLAMLFIIASIAIILIFALV